MTQEHWQLLIALEKQYGRFRSFTDRWDSKNVQPAGRPEIVVNIRGIIPTEEIKGFCERHHVPGIIEVAHLELENITQVRIRKHGYQPTLE